MKSPNLVALAADVDTFTLLDKAGELFDAEELQKCLADNEDHNTSPHDYATSCVVQALLSGEFGDVQLTPKQFSWAGLQVLRKVLPSAVPFPF